MIPAVLTIYSFLPSTQTQTVMRGAMVMDFLMSGVGTIMIINCLLKDQEAMSFVKGRLKNLLPANNSQRDRWLDFHYVLNSTIFFYSRNRKLFSVQNSNQINKKKYLLNINIFKFSYMKARKKY